MKYYLGGSVLYLVVAVAIVLAVRENGAEVLQGAWGATYSLAPEMGKIMVLLVLVGTILAALSRMRRLGPMMMATLMALAGTIVFQAGYSLIKSTLPYVAPFWADPPLARMAKFLNGGRDGWQITHDWSQHLPMEWLFPFYLVVWALPAMCLPMWMAATDPDTDRVRRTMVLYVSSWIILGNVIALAGISAGPIFYDRLYGGDRFAGLVRLHSDPAFIASGFVHIQKDLWTNYITHNQAIGFGISAFPSVHVGIAAVTALYMAERSRLLAPFGILFVLIILYLSVYSGYHYALDGYASIIVVLAIWAWLRRVSPRWQLTSA